MSVNSSTKPPRSIGRRIARFAVRIGVFYLLLLGGMMWFENRFVYLPTRFEDGWNPAPPGVQDVSFASADGLPLHGWWLPAPPANGALVMFHGNGGNLSLRGPSLERLRTATGRAVFIFDYPGYGKSAGKPSESGCYESGRAAVRWLAEQGFSSDRVVFYGESLGGGVAVQCATEFPCRALVLVKTFTATPDVGQERFPFLPVRLLMRNRFENLSKIGALSCPILIAGADRDRVVPFHHSEKLFAAANEPKQFFRVIGGDHNDHMPDEFTTVLKKFLGDTP